MARPTDSVFDRKSQLAFSDLMAPSFCRFGRIMYIAILAAPAISDQSVCGHGCGLIPRSPGTPTATALEKQSCFADSAIPEYWNSALSMEQDTEE
jgi:hypothetical protein